jgi:hypothetical protein
MDIRTPSELEAATRLQRLKKLSVLLARARGRGRWLALAAVTACIFLGAYWGVRAETTYDALVGVGLPVFLAFAVLEATFHARVNACVELLEMTGLESDRHDPGGERLPS